MEIIKTINEVRLIIAAWKKEGLSIGFVPTMGYLHEGHQSLIERAAAENDRVVASVFVNPLQFGPTEDFSSYPRDLKRDMEVCRNSGAHMIFHPEADEMYFPDFCTHVDMDSLTAGLCGKSRPGHFRGVCTVVCKLFNIVGADRAYFGEKDAQQLAVIRRMVRDLNMAVEIIGCPIIREKDGLAKSSRNTYLSPLEREAALILKKSLDSGRKLADEGERNARIIVDTITENFVTEPLARLDYVELVDAFSMEKVDAVDRPVLVAVAAYIGKTRLIDNFFFEPASGLKTQQ
ncbi:pantothenate synthetase [Ruminiclostridium hungatei]|uniref:Pantothenate synthetase n=1 Tax=Ruminiclostridium hungatei TaxID=48256 RepID=A0A1V4SQ36_RUMHU|nr:pantoate--beta-alanine ligase [Ruminiclostridium hungatei]OPX46018.1 pantothenate synthetase [Ruminiclostridium hungatei]